MTPIHLLILGALAAAHPVVGEQPLSRHEAGTGVASPPVPIEAGLASGSHETLLGFDRTDLLILAGLGTAALSVGTNDDAAQLEAVVSRGLDDSPLDGPIDVADLYGDGVTLTAASLGMLGLGHLTGNAELGGAGADLTRSLAVAWAATWTLKVAVDARRPNGGRYSFPSGHTATAFAAAPVIHAHFGDAAGYTAYLLASLTALARVEEGKHHLADVFAGAAIGVLAGRLFTRDDAPYALGVGAQGVEVAVRF